MKNHKKSKFKKLCWFSAGWAVLFVCFVLLLLHKPACYAPAEAAYNNQVSPYLTHVLSPQLYNGAQRRQPFNLIVRQRGINDVIARSGWPKEFDGIRFLTPKVFFVPDSIVLMGTAVVGGAELVVTIIGKPALDDDGLLNLRVAKVKVGAVNITFLAKAIAERMYKKQAGRADIDTETLGAKIAASLLNNEPFEPVFEIEDKKVRVKKIAVKQEKLTVHFVPVFD